MSATTEAPGAQDPVVFRTGTVDGHTATVMADGVTLSHYFPGGQSPHNLLSLRLSQLRALLSTLEMGLDRLTQEELIYLADSLVADCAVLAVAAHELFDRSTAGGAA